MQALRLSPQLTPLVGSHLLAIVGGIVSWTFLHTFPIRGDVGLICELALGIVSYNYHRLQHGSEAVVATAFAASIVTCHYVALAITTVVWRLSPFHPLAKFPGPLLYKCTNLTLAATIWSGRRHMRIYHLHQTYGIIVRTGPDTLSINSEEAITPIYGSAQAFSKSDAYDPTGLKGDGLFFIRPREVHNVRRKIWAQAFTPAAIAAYKPIVEERTTQLIGILARRREGPRGCVNLGKAIQHWTYDIMGDLTFGGANCLELMRDGDPNSYVDGGQAWTATFDILGHIPTLAHILLRTVTFEGVKNLPRISRIMIENRRKVKALEGNDIASHLLGEHDPSQPALPFEDLCLDTLFAIQAGSDTTSGVLSIGFALLLQNREAHLRLREELDEAFPDFGALLDIKKLESLPYLSAVIDEFLRLGTPLPGFPRVTPKGGAYIADAFIPEKTIVGVPIYTQAIDPTNFWPDPEALRPERWLPGGLGPGSRASKSAVQAFSYGPFGCLGKQVALQQMRIVISKLLLTYDISLPPDFDGTKFADGIRNTRSTILDYPLRVIVTARH